MRFALLLFPPPVILSVENFHYWTDHLDNSNGAAINFSFQNNLLSYLAELLKRKKQLAFYLSL